MSRAVLRGPLLAVAACLAAAPLQASEPAPAGATDPVLLDAELLPRARRSLLLDGVATAEASVLVGERGHVLTSNDGKTWQQSRVPTRATLTAIARAGDVLWAGGHDGVLLRSSDAGKSWERRRASPWTPDLVEPSEGVPVLDLIFLDDKQGFAIGAYSLLLRTDDGGETWVPQSIHGEAPGAAMADAPADEAGDDWSFSEDDLSLGAESDPHLNAIARAGSGALAITGERGTFLRSRDGGKTWENRRLPYEGSMFGILAWEGEHLLVFGLRGNVYESTDLGDSWRKVETGIGTSLMGGLALPGGGAVLVGANGAVLLRADASAPFRAATFANANGETPLLAGVLPAAEQSYLLFGDKGAELYRPE